MKKPSLGRIVIFSSGIGDPVPAVIVRVWSDTCVNLVLMSDQPADNGRIVTSVLNGASAPKGGMTWDWPPTV